MPESNKNFVTGDWVAVSIEIENRKLSKLSDLTSFFAQVSPDHLYATLAQAQRAQRKWAAYGSERKYTVLMAIGIEIMVSAEESNSLPPREKEKPFAEGKGELYRAALFLTYCAAETLSQMGDTADSGRQGTEIDLCHKAVGVVAMISPWNFPTTTTFWKIAPALACKYAVIFKPKNLTPAWVVALTEIISRKDIPKGLLSLVMEAMYRVGQILVESAKVNAISFTSSVLLGKGIATLVLQNLIKVQMEIGSKNALAVKEDAYLDLAVSLALGGTYGGSGQKCAASLRLVVYERIHDAFVIKMIAGPKAMVVGHALVAGTQSGPVVGAQQLQENHANVALELADVELVCGGQQVELVSKGFYMSLELLINCTTVMRINREELFAPLAVIKMGSYDEALSVVNGTRCGATPGILTTNLALAAYSRRNANTGCVMVSLLTAGTDYYVPFGLRGKSSVALYKQGSYAAEFYTTAKAACISSGVLA